MSNDESGVGSGRSGWRIRWTPSAFRDLESAYDYVRRVDRAAARRLAASIRSATTRLSEHPESGSIVENLEPPGRYRQVVVPPYRILYWLAEPDVIVIARIWDGRRDPEGLTV